MRKVSGRFILFCFVFFVSLLLVASTIPPSGTIIETHHADASSSYVGTYQGYQLMQAQQFYLDAGVTQPLSGIGIFLKDTDYGNPTGDVTVAIHTNETGNVPGSAINESVQSFTPTLGVWNYIQFSGDGITLGTSDENKYWIVVTTSDQSGENDAYRWTRSTSNTYDRGYRKTFNKNGSGQWETETGDFSFQVFGDLTMDVCEPVCESSRASGFLLRQNFPNPFNPETTISYLVPESGPKNVVLTIFDSTGRYIRNLVNSTKNGGSYQVRWNGKDIDGRVVGSGVYIYQLKIGDTIVSRKMLKLE